LGVCAIIAKSFARIHETNLKKQGVLALTFVNPSDYDKIQEKDRFSIRGLNHFIPGTSLILDIHHDNGDTEQIEVAHTYNQIQIAWFKAGSALNLMAQTI